MVGDVDMIMMQAHIKHLKRDMIGGGGMMNEFDGIPTNETFKELVEGVGTMRKRRKISFIIHSQKLGFSRAE